MAKTKIPSDVYISHPAHDAEIAKEVAHAAEANGLTVYRDRAADSNETLGDAAWDAMVESRALVLIATVGKLSERMLFELGAARAWNKPVYLVSEAKWNGSKAALQGVMIYPPSRIEALVRDIRNSPGVITDMDLSILVEEYVRVGEPADQLLLEPAKLDTLVKQFNKRTHHRVDSEELVRALFRLRKRGSLPATPKRSGVKAS